MKEAKRRYNATLKGQARNLRANHGYSLEDSILLASLTENPYTRCAICGVPGRWLRVKADAGWRGSPFGRLTVDHVKAGGPSTMENSRILCGLCNTHRGAEERTDYQTLRKTKQWYEYRNFSTADLWWIHTIPGHGGLDRLGSERVHKYGN